MGAGGAPPGVPDMESVYDTIAEAWARTRSGAWPAVRSFLRSVPRGQRLADIGSGSGRYFSVDEAQGLRIIALDFSRGQLAVARRVAGPHVALARADVRALPLRAGAVDGALLVAVIHHLPKRSERVQSLREMLRALRPGGRALVANWSAGAEVFEGARPLEGGEKGDFLVPFKERLERPAQRFFHAYGEGELTGELREAGFGAVREWIEAQNRFAEVVR
jgi:tRNA (uracil-5-)-methyltransferase TRM9